MGFYFASKRNGGAPLSRGRIGEYERLPASSFRYVASTRSKDFVSYLALSFFHVFIASLFLRKIKSTTAFVSTKLTSLWVPLKLTDMLPMNIPDIGVCFKKGARLTTEMEQTLERYEGLESTRIISGKKSWNVHICRGVTSADLPKFLGWAKYTDPSYSGSAALITPTQITDFVSILSILSTVVFGLRNLFTTIAEYEGTTPAVWYDDMPEKELDLAGIVDEETLDFESGIIQDGKARFRVGGKKSVGFLRWAGKEDATPVLAWGKIEECTWKSGLALPFDKDVSMPDRNGISSLISDNIRLCDKRTVDENSPAVNILVDSFDKSWREGIMSTRQGEWIAHIVSCVSLAKKCHASIFTIFTNGTYEGSILGPGDYAILVKSDVYVHHTGESFDAEKALINAHRVNLSKLMSLLKMPVGTEQPKTLRSLRAMVNPANYSGEEKSKALEYILDLNFGNSVEPINLSTMKEVLTLLSLDNPIVDKRRFMDPESFWSEDKETMVLSMFGRRAPVFSTGQTLRKMAKVTKGEGSTKAAAYSSTPPDVLQVAMRPLGTAVSTWKGLMSSGLAKGNWESEVRGNVVFRKQMKVDLWSHMNNCLVTAIGKEAGSGAGDKRDRDGDSDEEEGEILPPQKKEKKAFSFF